MRQIFGFAIIAVIVWIVLQLVLGLLGFAIALAFRVLIWDVIGYALFMLLKWVAPDTARKLTEMVRGKSAA